MVLSATAFTPSAPVSFDLGSMAKSGSTCSSAGTPDLHVTCTLGTVGAGARPTVYLIAQTSGLSSGSQVAGKVAVTSTDAATVTGTLDAILVVVVPNTVITAVVPGVQVQNTTAPLSMTNGIQVRLKTPKKVLANTLGAPAIISAGRAPAHGPRSARATSRASRAAAAASSMATPPPISVIIGPVNPNQDYLLCPPPVSCYGSVAQVDGNFSAYTDRTHPCLLYTSPSPRD